MMAATTKTKEEQTKPLDPMVKDAATAMAYLIDGEFKSEDDELTPELLSVIAMQLSQQLRFTKQASEAFKALSYLIFDLHQKRTAEAITDVIAKAVSVATKRVREELEEATELLTSAAVASTNTVEELREECRGVVADLKEAIEEATSSLELAGTNQRQEGLHNGGGGMETDSYADRVKKCVPAVHAAAVAKAELQKRKIRLIKAVGLTGDGVGDLTEKQWVEKANLALSLMEGHWENKPEVVNFAGVNKERGGGGVIFEMNTGEAAGWLKDKRVMSAFLAKMGSTVDYKMHTYEVVVDWVPVSFEVDQPAAWKRVEQSNGLGESAIREVVWIKPTHLRSEGQRTAIAIFRLATREDANLVIENGLYVEGKKVWGRKQVQEPKRCLKCQCFGEHKAAKCASIHEVCGRCGKQHRTSLCSETAKDTWECSNCKSTGNGKHKGHGAADRRCPVFLARVARMNKTRQENKYRFFCTDDPATWETNEDGYDVEHNTEGVHGQGGEPQRWERARGRLGGGSRGEGGGFIQRQRDKGWEGVRADTRAGGSKDNGNVQTEAPRIGKTVGAGRDGDRAYRQGPQKGAGPLQATLNEMWKGKEKDTRSWSEDMAIMEREREKDRQQSAISYV